MENSRLISLLCDQGLKITPQRMAVLEAVFSMNNHPTAEQVSEFIKKNHPHIATGTVYKTLETFVEKGLVNMVMTEYGIMRYEAVSAPHHHLYCAASERIEDYTDPALQQLLEDYFREHKIPGFEIQDMKLHIIGNFTRERTDETIH